MFGRRVTLRLPRWVALPRRLPDRTPTAGPTVPLTRAQPLATGPTTCGRALATRLTGGRALAAGPTIPLARHGALAARLTGSRTLAAGPTA
ncbi:hypothetical protein RB614_41805 [Phytohabitans sp. ZYX-F-186]|uniref:Uncharacterized protein n=1 Tax=Phytohabitans maris TaxID=3071409 RepID=A0ABU0ZVI8_9ACTN|nr:hypothetical protein [Phytohabitans sp. ZYX-F-186]MDQ7911044.1 hypothetical protein [Phytohabitans sp. ZYX-F-186]